jgi:hypothetical protein
MGASGEFGGAWLASSGAAVAYASPGYWLTEWCALTDPARWHPQPPASQLATGAS